MFEDNLKANLNLEITDRQREQFATYYRFLIEYNEITNLTRITEKDEVYYKHFYDSLTLAKSIDLHNIGTLCDMGAGAGFPSIPLKIMFPHLQITIIDSLGKRIAFLNQLIDRLNVHNVQLVYDRIENYAQENHEKYDVVTARALGKLPLILELGLPMVNMKGHFIAYKSSQYQDEIDQSNRALNILGGEITSIIPIVLPKLYGDRTHILIKKIKKTPKIYPRPFNIIKKKTI